MKRFTLFEELGVITVPKDYAHATQLEKFRRENENKFVYYSKELNDKDFSNPSFVLQPGMRLNVSVFKQEWDWPDRGKTPYTRIMAFLKRLHAVHPSAQGISLVFEQRRDILPKGRKHGSSRYITQTHERGIWYTSYDYEDKLPDIGSNRKGAASIAVNTDEFAFGTSATCDEMYDMFLCFRMIN